MNNPSSDMLSVTRASRGSVKVASMRSLALVAADAGAFLAATCLAYAAHMAIAAPPSGFDFGGQGFAQGLQWHGWGTILVVVVLLGYFASRGHYTARVPFWTELSGVTAGVCVALLSDNFVRSGVYADPFGFEAVTRWLLFVPCLLLFRRAARRGLQACGAWALRTLIVGESDAVASVRAALTSEPALGYDVVGIANLRRAGAPGRGGGGGLAALREFDAEFVVLAIGGRDTAAENAAIACLARSQVPFALVPAFDGIPVAGIGNQYFFSHDVMLLTCGNNLARPICRAIKALFDQAVAALLLVLLSPLFLVLCAMIRLDGGPALFGHRRVGESGRWFRCLKFRTMTTDADAVLHDLLERDPAARAEWRATQKLRADPRVTRVGQVLRKTSLDELPQLLNVLRGEMSLVGPRPIVDAEIEHYGDKIAFYYEAKPGITGLWQVSGRSDTSYVDRVKLDVWYVRNWTLWHDIAILLKTVPAVLLKKGAI